MKIEELVKMVKIQNDMNQICLDLIKNKSSNTKMLLNQFKSNKLFSNDIIDLLMAEYYIKHVGKNKNNSLVNFIEDYHLNKDFLQTCFNNNDGLAIEIISSYLKTYFNMDREVFKPLSSKENKIATSLSSVINYIGFNYITTLARATLFKLATENILKDINIKVENDKFEIDDVNILSKILISDAYTYMNVHNDDKIYSELISIIEEGSNNLENLDYVLQNKSDCLYKLLYFQAMLFLEYDIFTDAYSSALKNNDNFMKTMKKINPYYIVDLIESNELVKYRK